MSRTILYKLDQGFRLVECLKDGLYNLEIGSLIMAADIVNLSDSALPDNKVDCLAVIRYIQPVADIRTVSVNRKLLVIQRS